MADVDALIFVAVQDETTLTLLGRIFHYAATLLLHQTIRLYVNEIAVAAVCNVSALASFTVNHHLRFRLATIHHVLPVPDGSGYAHLRCGAEVAGVP